MLYVNNNDVILFCRLSVYYLFFPQVCCPCKLVPLLLIFRLKYTYFITVCNIHNNYKIVTLGLQIILYCLLQNDMKIDTVTRGEKLETF